MGHLGFLKLIVDEELNNFTVFPLNIPAGHFFKALFFPSKFHYENGHTYKNVESIHTPITVILLQSSDITYLYFYIFIQGEEGFHSILGMCKQV